MKKDSKQTRLYFLYYKQYGPVLLARDLMKFIMHDYTVDSMLYVIWTGLSWRPPVCVLAKADVCMDVYMEYINEKYTRIKLDHCALLLLIYLRITN